MAKQQTSANKKPLRGPPPRRQYWETIPVRLTPEAVEEIGVWIERQEELPSRSEAIRELIFLGLKASSAPSDKEIAKRTSKMLAKATGKGARTIPSISRTTIRHGP